MSEEGERIRIPMAELDAPAYGIREATPPPTDAEADPENDLEAKTKAEYQKLIRELLTGNKEQGAIPPANAGQTPPPKEVPTLEDLPPVRKFEEVDPSYEERRLAALAAAQSEPVPEVEEEVAAYLPVGGDAVDLKTAAKMGLIPEDEIFDEPHSVEEARESLRIDRAAHIEREQKLMSVSKDFYFALLEVFNSIEAIPVEGNELTLEEFNEAMDRQARAREAVRKLIRG